MQERVPNDKVDPPEKRGCAPTSKEDGKPIEIHHNEQNPNGPFREMTQTDHRGPGNYKANHPNLGQPSKIDRAAWRRQVREYWNQEWDKGKWNP